MSSEALRLSEARYTALIEHTPDAITLTAADGKVVYANPAVLPVIGYSAEQLVGMNILTIIHPADVQDFVHEYTALLDRPGDFVRLEYRLRHYNGSWCWIEDTTTNLLHERSVLALMHTLRDITARKESETYQEAEEARRRLYELFMQAPANIAIMSGPQHRFVLANEPFLHTVGLTRAEALGKVASEVIPGISAQGFGELMKQVYETGIPFVGTEVPIKLHRQGNETPEEGFFNFVYQPFRNRHGEIEGVMLHGVEVTEQVHARRRVEELAQALQKEKEALYQAQQEITQTASQLEAIFDAMTDGIVVCDRQGKLLRANAIFRSYAGVEGKTMMGLTANAPQPEWLIPHDAEGLPLSPTQWPFMRVLQGEHFSGSTSIDISFHTRDDQMIFFNVNGAPIYDDAGTITGGVVVLRDMTQRHQLEQQLRFSERKLSSLVNANILGVAVADGEGHILEANDRLTQMLGYSKEDLLAETFHWRALTPPELLRPERQVLKALVSAGAIVPWEREYLRKDGSRFPALITAAMIDHERMLAIVIVLDISERKAAEQRKQEFLSMVSHELRTPLTGIVGFLDLAHYHIQHLAETLSSESRERLGKVEAMLQQAEQEANVENRLVDALLDVSRMEQHTFELSLTWCDLLQVVQEVILAQQQINWTRRITLVVPHKPALVVVDRDRIAQVLNNYITNALKYAPDDQEIVVGLTVEDNSARVFVRDQGPGLTPEQQQHIWERFYQASEKRGGLGLGLYIVSIIVEQHHGQVGVESRPGHGSTFWFTLPLAKAPIQIREVRHSQHE